MINQTRITKASELKQLRLSGLSVVAVTAGVNGTDFKSVTLRDEVTKVHLTFAIGQYSDMIFSAEFPPKTKEQYVFVGQAADGEFRSSPKDSEDSFEELKSVYREFKIEKVQTPVED